MPYRDCSLRIQRFDNDVPDVPSVEFHHRRILIHHFARQRKSRGVPGGAPRVEGTSPTARISVARVHGKAIPTAARFGFIAGSVRHLRFPIRYWASVRTIRRLSLFASPSALRPYRPNSTYVDILQSPCITSSKKFERLTSCEN